LTTLALVCLASVVVAVFMPNFVAALLVLMGFGVV
jgi:hypothetical protein